MLRTAASLPLTRGCRLLPLISNETSAADRGISAVMPTGVTVGIAARMGSSSTCEVLEHLPDEVSAVVAQGIDDENGALAMSCPEPLFEAIRYIRQLWDIRGRAGDIALEESTVQRVRVGCISSVGHLDYRRLALPPQHCGAH